MGEKLTQSNAFLNSGLVIKTDKESFLFNESRVFLILKRQCTGIPIHCLFYSYFTFLRETKATIPTTATTSTVPTSNVTVDDSLSTSASSLKTRIAVPPST